jgi:UDP-2,3-diacylglucosamine hydrolase
MVTRVSTVESIKPESTLAERSLGLIAGEGSLPVILAQSAKEKGYRVVAFALSETARDQVEKIVDKVHLIAPGQMGRNAKLFKEEGLNQAVFVGKVPKLNLLRNITKLDWVAIRELSKLPNFNDDTIQFAMGDYIEAQGIKILTQSEFLRHLFPGVGVLTKRQPTTEEYADIDYGMKMAKEIARLDIGQTVIVRDRMILAIEAIEGTDEAIKRAVGYARGPVVVVKVAKPNQDQRFDIPTVGLNTLNCMLADKPGGVLALEAHETMVVDREEMIKFCDQNKIAMVSVSHKPMSVDE